MKEIVSNKDYKQFFSLVAQQIKSSQAKAAASVNAALIIMYWNIGKMIAENQSLFEGRNNYIDQLAKDIQLEFPGQKGFSKRNLFVIRSFYLFYSSNSVQQVAAPELSVLNNKIIISITKVARCSKLLHCH